MQLFCSVNSPYARKCRVILREHGVSCDEVMVNALENPPELLAVNPLGKVPVLVTDAGLPLCDSTIIAEYLDARGSGARLIPEGAERLPLLALAALADGVMDLAVEWVLQTRRPAEMQWPDWIARRREAILRTLRVLERCGLMADEAVTLAHINIGCALAYLDFRHPTLLWRAECPALAAFLDAFSQRASMQQTRPEA